MLQGTHKRLVGNERAYTKMQQREGQRKKAEPEPTSPKAASTGCGASTGDKNHGPVSPQFCTRAASAMEPCCQRLTALPWRVRRCATPLAARQWLYAD